MRKDDSMKLQKLSAIALTVGMLTTFAPAALAAETIAPPADLPTATQYIQDTDGVDDGAVYAIYTNVSPDVSNRILYHTDTGKTDKVGGTVSGNTLALNGSFAASRQLWTVTAVEGGYTLQNMDSNYYLDLTESSASNINTSQTPVTLTIGFEEESGTYTISQEGGYALSYTPDNNGVVSAGSEAASLRFFKMTEVEVEQSDGVAPSGTSQDQPFVKSDTGSNYFRIPSLVTLDNGWIVATSDIRWRTSGDAANNLDTIVSISKDGGKTWEWEVVNYFDDMTNTSTGSYSACFIDPSVIQASDGTVHMVVDACPSYTGLFNSKMGYESSGFDAQGRMIVALGEANADAPTAASAYDYYVDINNSAAGQAITVDGEEMTLYPICSYADDSETGYYVDAFLDLYYNYGEDEGVQAVYCVQLNGSVAVQNNLFYRQSQWKAYPVFYIMHRSATVTADGLEWSEPQFLDIKLSSNEAFTGVCPGRGTVAMVDGVERILFPLYDNQTGTELASVIYSDDGGQTWTRGQRASALNGTGKSSESQIVVLPDGNLRMYSRNTINYISYADSTDGGVSWGAYQRDMDLYTKNPGNGCMVSFINLDGVLVSPDGTRYENLILASYPVTQRSEGVVRIGSIDAETNEVTWLNDDEVRFSGSGGYSYSCLTQLSQLDTFGLLYEYDNTTGTIGYVALTVNDLLGDGWYLNEDGTEPAPALGVTLSGSSVTTVNGLANYTFSLEGESDNLADIGMIFTVSGSDAGVLAGRSLTVGEGFSTVTEPDVVANAGGSYTYVVTLSRNDASATDLLHLKVRAAAAGSITVKLDRVAVTYVDDQTETALAAGASATTRVVEGSLYDINGNGVFDLADVTLTRLEYYQAQQGDDNWDVASRADLNGDGVVDLVDLVELANAYQEQSLAGLNS